MKTRNVALIAAAMLILAATGSGPEYRISAVTDCQSGLNINPHLSADGSAVTFISSCDLVRGDNIDRSTEIYSITSGKIKQLTSETYCQIFDLVPSPDDRHIAFFSNCSFRGKNKSKSVELMLMDQHGEVTVITRSLGRELKDMAWSADSRALYFSASADLAGDNLDNSREIFVADIEATPPTLRQITRTNAPHGCSNPLPVPGAVLALCDEDFPETVVKEDRGLPLANSSRKISGNPDNNVELMSFGLEGEPRQLTHTVKCKNGPAVAESQGRVVALVSDCNLLDLPNPTGRPTLLLYSDGKFTPAVPNRIFEPAGLTMSQDGTVLAFCASFYTSTQNRGRNQEVFVLRLNELKLDPPKGRDSFPPGLHLVSDISSGNVRAPSLSADGRTVAFASNTRIGDENRDGNYEIFLAHPLPVNRLPHFLQGDDSSDDELEEPETIEDESEADEPDLDAGDTVEASDDEEPADEPEEVEPPTVDEHLLPPEMRTP